MDEDGADGPQGGDAWDAAVGEPGAPPPPAWSQPGGDRPASLEPVPDRRSARAPLRDDADPDHPPQSQRPYGVDGYDDVDADPPGFDLEKAQRFTAEVLRREKRRALIFIPICLAFVGALIVVAALVGHRHTSSGGPFDYDGQGPIKAKVGQPISTTADVIPVGGADTYRTAPVTVTVTDVRFPISTPGPTKYDISLSLRLCSPVAGADMNATGDLVAVYDDIQSVDAIYPGTLPDPDPVPAGGCRTATFLGGLPPGTRPVSVVFGDHRRAEWVLSGS